MKDKTKNKIGIAILSFGLIIIGLPMFWFGFNFITFIGLIAFILLIIVNIIELKDSRSNEKENKEVNK